MTTAEKEPEDQPLGGAAQARESSTFHAAADPRRPSPRALAWSDGPSDSPVAASRARVRTQFFAAGEAFQCYDVQLVGFVLDKLLDILGEEGIKTEPYIADLCSDEAHFDQVFATLAT